MSDRAIGIDIGTIYCRVGYWESREVQLVPLEAEECRALPACIAFNEERRLIGSEAKDQAATNMANTIFNIKRLIGRSHDDSVTDDWTFRENISIGGDARDKPMIEVYWKGEAKSFYVEEIYAMIMRKLNELASRSLSAKDFGVVIAVPSHFNVSQRQATKDAATIAGLNLLSLISETSAIALTYAQSLPEDCESQTLLVFDLGGGSLDVSLHLLKDNTIKALAAGGNGRLGGEEFDTRLVEYCANEFENKYGLDVRTHPRAMRLLRTECEKAKRTLSTATHASIVISVEDDEFSTRITRARFEDLNKDLFDKCRNAIEKMLEDLGFPKEDVDVVLLSGGSTRIPKIGLLIEDYFGSTRVWRCPHREEAVVRGASMMAADLIGVNSDGRQQYEVTEVLSQCILMAEGDDYVALLDKNVSLPNNRYLSMKVSTELQPCAELEVYEGDSPEADDIGFIGNFAMSCEPQAEKRIEVCLEIDADGTLDIMPSEDDTCGITIISDRVNLSTEQIDRARLAAEGYEAEERALDEGLEARNAFEEYCLSMLQYLSEEGVESELHPTVFTAATNILEGVLEWCSSLERPDKNDCTTRLENIRSMMDAVKMEAEGQLKSVCAWLEDFCRHSIQPMRPVNPHLAALRHTLDETIFSTDTGADDENTQFSQAVLMRAFHIVSRYIKECPNPSNDTRLKVLRSDLDQSMRGPVRKHTNHAAGDSPLSTTNTS